jgi:hypothetical protein
MNNAREVGKGAACTGSAGADMRLSHRAAKRAHRHARALRGQTLCVLATSRFERLNQSQTIQTWRVVSDDARDTRQRNGVTVTCFTSFSLFIETLPQPDRSSGFITSWVPSWVPRPGRKAKAAPPPEGREANAPSLALGGGLGGGGRGGGGLGGELVEPVSVYTIAVCQGRSWVTTLGRHQSAAGRGRVPELGGGDGHDVSRQHVYDDDDCAE